MNQQSVQDLLAAARAAEKAQALRYRALAAAAEEVGDAAASQRLNELHADEQHHLSRLTARLIELGIPLADLAGVHPETFGLDVWEAAARPLEEDEVRRYEHLLAEALDEPTAALISEILSTERHHAQELGGKWMPA